MPVATTSTVARLGVESPARDSTGADESVPTRGSVRLTVGVTRAVSAAVGNTAGGRSQASDSESRRVTVTGTLSPRPPGKGPGCAAS
jgi:hypothetical protein